MLKIIITALISTFLMSSCVEAPEKITKEGIRFPSGIFWDSSQERLFFVNSDIDLGFRKGALKYFDLKGSKFSDSDKKSRLQKDWIAENKSFSIDSFALDIFEEKFNHDGKEVVRLAVPTRKRAITYFVAKAKDGSLATKYCSDKEDATACISSFSIKNFKDPGGVFALSCPSLKSGGKQRNRTFLFSLDSGKVYYFRSHDLYPLGYIQTSFEFTKGILKALLFESSPGKPLVFLASKYSNKIEYFDPCNENDPSGKILVEPREEKKELFQLKPDEELDLKDLPLAGFTSPVYIHGTAGSAYGINDFVQIPDQKNQFLALFRNPNQLLHLYWNENDEKFQPMLRTPLQGRPYRILPVSGSSLAVLGQVDSEDSSLYLVDYKRGFLVERKRGLAKTIFNLIDSGKGVYFASSFEEHSILPFTVDINAGQIKLIKVEKSQGATK